MKLKVRDKRIGAHSGMATWRSTQVGTLAVGMLLGGMAFTVWVGRASDRVAPTMGLLAGLGLLILLFHSLTVAVSPEVVRCYFGFGAIARTIRLDTVDTAQAVRNPWYSGWGIRSIPHGWMFNVSGFDAVELCLNDGRRFRIGTSDPDGVVSAIRAMKSQVPNSGPGLPTQ